MCRYDIRIGEAPLYTTYPADHVLPLSELFFILIFMRVKLIYEGGEKRYTDGLAFKVVNIKSIQ